MDRVLVQRAEAVAKSKGGILIPEKAQSKVIITSFGCVIMEIRGNSSICVLVRQKQYMSDYYNCFQVLEGTVVAVGPGARSSTGANIPMAVAVGDKVALPEYGGSKVELENTVSYVKLKNWQIST